MNIVIAGLTAAGKTTHALLIARWLGYDYVSASALLLNRVNMDSDGSNTMWVRRSAEIERHRDERPVDREVNEYLRAELNRRDRTVFDSWSAAWLGGPPCLRIYLESDRNSRARKVRVSQEPHGPYLPLAECRHLIDQKDGSTAARLRPLLGVDIRYDRVPFDLVLDNSALIDQPTIVSARRGIKEFHGHLVRAIKNHLRGRDGLP